MGGTYGSSSPWVGTLSWYFDATIRLVLLVYVATLPFKKLLVVERHGFLVLIGLLVVWCVARKRFFYRRTPYDLWLLAFVLWVGLTIPFAAFPSYSFKEYGKLLQGMTVLYAVVWFLADGQSRKTLLLVLGTSLFLVSAYGLTQFNVANPQAIVSSFPAEVWLTTFLVMTLPYALAAAYGDHVSGMRWSGAVLSVTATACLLSTQSRAGLIALATELAVMAWVMRTALAKWTAGAVTLGLVLVVLLAVWLKSPGSAGTQPAVQSSIPVKTGVATIVHRLDIWKFTLSEIGEHWLVGVGYGGQTYSMLYGDDAETVAPGHAAVKAQGAHNILLYLALHVGVAGMALFLGFYVSLVRTTAKAYRAATDGWSRLVLAGTVGSMVGLFVRLQFDQMLVGALAVLFWVLVGMSILALPPWDSHGGESVPS
jgi:O-antigen ligase